MAHVAQSVVSRERCNSTDVGSIPGGGKGIREKILDAPSVGVGGKTYGCKISVLIKKK